MNGTEPLAIHPAAQHTAAAMPRLLRLLPKLAPLAAIGVIAWAERRWPRRPVEKPERVRRNLTFGMTALTVAGSIGGPATRWVARGNAASRRAGGPRGLTAALPTPVAALAGFVLADYTIYLWHVATHRVPLLWRLHRVHHIDRALDSSTALRFHAADMLVSVPMDMARLRLIGAGPGTWTAWQTFFGLSVLFHHSNITLPTPWERRLNRLFTTPGMHDIHHQAERERTDSNWSSGLSIWDRLHRTFRAPGERAALAIGVAGYPHDLHIADLMALPLEPTGRDWPAADWPEEQAMEEARAT